MFARFLQDKVSPRVAEEYRSDVFKSQMMIGSKDDLRSFNMRWMQKHHLQMPFAVDPTGQLAKEVQADYDLGMRLRVEFTPTIVVVTDNEYQVVAGAPDFPIDTSLLLPVVEGALKKAGSARVAAPMHVPAKKR